MANTTLRVLAITLVPCFVSAGCYQSKQWQPEPRASTPISEFAAAVDSARRIEVVVWCDFGDRPIQRERIGPIILRDQLKIREITRLLSKASSIVPCKDPFARYLDTDEAEIAIVTDRVPDFHVRVSGGRFLRLFKNEQVQATMDDNSLMLHCLAIAKEWKESNPSDVIEYQ